MPHHAAARLARSLTRGARFVSRFAVTASSTVLVHRNRETGTAAQLKKAIPILVGLCALGFGAAIPLGYSAPSCHAKHNACTTSTTTTTQTTTTTSSTPSTTTTTTTPTTTTAPTTTTPANGVAESIKSGSTLAGGVTWTATASGATPTVVKFSIDGSVKWDESSAPYQYNGDPTGVLDTTTLGNGSHTFGVVASYSDGTSSSASATATVQNTTSPATTTTTTTTNSSVDPSGVPMPSGDVTVNGQAWHQVFADNFPSTENVGLGSSCGDTNAFPHAANVTAKWTAYPWGWSGTPTWGSYCPERTTSIHDGVMDIWLHSEQIGGVWKHLIDAVEPRFSAGSGDSQLYGRYVIRYEEPTSFPMFHVSWLLWPDSNTWPGDGEIDFPEADTNGSSTSAFMHWQGGTSGGSQDAYTAAAAIYGVWHTAVIEWLPTRCSFYLDGNLVGNSTNTSHIPDTPMHYVIQNGGSFGATPDNTSNGHILIDWLAIYSRG